MVIALFGDSCTGKSTIAAALAPSLSAEVFSGKGVQDRDMMRRAMLEAEGVPFTQDGRVAIDRCRWQPGEAGLV